LVDFSIFLSKRGKRKKNKPDRLKLRLNKDLNEIRTKNSQELKNVPNTRAGGL
jgi:hypothetical protein